MKPIRLAILICSVLAVGVACATPDPEGDNAKPVSNFDLTVGVAAPGSLDPARVDTESARWILNQICDPLVSFDPSTGELLPGIAEAWAVSQDARRVTFNLREGIKFHDGEVLEATDYVASLSRLVRPETQSPFYHLLTNVVGYSEVRTQQVPFLAGVTAPDPHTLVVELSEPFAPFPEVMANPSVGAAVSTAAVNDPERDFDVRPVCAGPYKIDGTTGSEEQIGMVRFDDYEGAQPALQEDGRGYAATIRWRIAFDEQKAYEMFESGKVDVAAIPAAKLAQARESRASISSSDSGHLTYVGLPVTQAGFDSTPFRRALALSMDRSAIVMDMLGRTRGIAEGFLPKSAGPAAALSACGEAFPPKPQTDAARAAAEEAAAPPSTLTLHLNDSGGHEHWMRAVADQWQAALGVETQLRSTDWESYIELLKDPGADGPFRLSWEVIYPSPEALLRPLFASDSPDNFTGYSNDRFDALLAEAASTVGPVERSEIYSQAAKVLCEDVPAIPVWFGTDHVAFGPKLAFAGKTRTNVFGDPILRELKYLQ
ncbi:MAG: ABC transporter substrate-binding protein [Actinomycetota bacterium]